MPAPAIPGLVEEFQRDLGRVLLAELREREAWQRRMAELSTSTAICEDGAGKQWRSMMGPGSGMAGGNSITMGGLVRDAHDRVGRLLASLQMVEEVLAGPQPEPAILRPPAQNPVDPRMPSVMESMGTMQTLLIRCEEVLGHLAGVVGVVPSTRGPVGGL